MECYKRPHQLLEYICAANLGPISVKCLLKTLLIVTGSVISISSCKIFGIVVEFLDLERRLLIPFQVSLVRPTLS